MTVYTLVSTLLYGHTSSARAADKVLWYQGHNSAASARSLEPDPFAQVMLEEAGASGVDVLEHDRGDRPVGSRNRRCRRVGHAVRGPAESKFGGAQSGRRPVHFAVGATVGQDQPQVADP